MPSAAKSLGLGIGVGIALTLVVGNLWLRHERERFIDSAQPQVRWLGSSPTQKSQFRSPWSPGEAKIYQNWALQRIDGSRFTLSDLKGKVVVVNLWLTTCAPCVAEMPSMDQLASSLRGEQIEFLAVSPEALRTVRTFIQEHPIGIPIALSHGEAERFLPGGYPTTLIFDAEGEIIWQYQGAFNWDDDGVRTYLRRIAARS